jgi:hypothetical protein
MGIDHSASAGRFGTVAIPASTASNIASIGHGIGAAGLPTGPDIPPQ